MSELSDLQNEMRRWDAVEVRHQGGGWWIRARRTGDMDWREGFGRDMTAVLARMWEDAGYWGERERARELFQVRVEGKPFHCPCGGNVFTKPAHRRYVCTACGAEFEGTPASGVLVKSHATPVSGTQ